MPLPPTTRTCHTLAMAAFAMAISLNGSIQAQDQLRTWGRMAGDTDMFRVPAQQVSSCLDREQAIVLTQNGRLAGMGDNNDGGAMPPEAPQGQYFTHLAASGVKVAALDNGQIIQWSPFWTGFSPPSSPPTLPAGLSWVELATTMFRGFALRSDGVLESWGTNWGGIEQIPPLPPGLQYTSISGSFVFMVATVSDGTIRVWGTYLSNVLSVPALPPGVTFTRARAGMSHVLALRSDGQIAAWGSNSDGQCNVPPLPASTAYIDIVGGGAHSLALRSDGQWVAWGSNSHGQCNIPAVGQTSFTALAGGPRHTIGIRTDGRVEIWGRLTTPPSLAPGVAYRELDSNGEGALVCHSDGTLQAVLSSPLPIPPSLPAGVTHRSTSVGFDFSLSLGSDGQARAWGSNSFGQLAVPPLPAGVVYTKVDTFSQSGAALRSNGTAVAWGLNSFGQTQIPALPAGQTYVDLSMGRHNVLLARSDGSLTITGLMSIGAAAVPALPAGRRAIDVACGYAVAAAILDDGSLLSWGSYGSAPALPTGLSYVEVECGELHAIARRSDGVVVTWGSAQQATTVPTPGPGRSFLRIATAMEGSAGLIGMASSYVPIGPGCAGTLPPARLVPRDTPQVGRTLPIAVTNLPIDVAFVAFGWSATQAPIPLDGIGMPGCAAHITVDTMVGLTGMGGQAVLQMPIPMQPTLRGVQFFNQAIVLDPTAGNNWNAVVSEAMVGLVGG